ncbi:hypothetical protein T10_12683 [Trichinella papuae]|uniref:Uncharacterized protein n=1 Tax=Trichinella papuae TaxID=268474 RepID=A0A0V1MIU9_9BILA|nr:hypothetical protein T10_12683 [Trichinella papuae]
MIKSCYPYVFLSHSASVKYSPNMKIAQKRIVNNYLWDVFLIGKHAIPVRAYMELLGLDSIRLGKLDNFSICAMYAYLDI